MRYLVPVWIRVFGKNAGDCTMRAIVNRGILGVLDGIGFYAVGWEEIDPADIRSQLQTAIEGTVVISASTAFDAINRFYRETNHPGIVGVGLEKPGQKAKAIYRDELMCSRPIWELPDCSFEGDCFSINPNGWATCQLVADDLENSFNEYCHCCLQGADEPPTGCLCEAYVNEAASMDIEAKTDGSGILYYPFMSDVYDRIER